MSTEKTITHKGVTFKLPDDGICYRVFFRYSCNCHGGVKDASGERAFRPEVFKANEHAGNCSDAGHFPSSFLDVPIGYPCPYCQETDSLATEVKRLSMEEEDGTAENKTCGK